MYASKQLVWPDKFNGNTVCPMKHYKAPTYSRVNDTKVASLQQWSVN